MGLEGLGRCAVSDELDLVTSAMGTRILNFHDERVSLSDSDLKGVAAELLMASQHGESKVLCFEIRGPDRPREHA
jgi:hypothetical protein